MSCCLFFFFFPSPFVATMIASYLAGEVDKLKMFSYCPTQYLGEFTFPKDLTFIVAVSGAEVRSVFLLPMLTA